MAPKRLLPTLAEACCPPARPGGKPSLDGFARVFKALADETRLEIVAMLAARAGDLCACEIESRFELSQPTISHHLKLLREAGLVTAERRGTWVHYALDRRALERVRELCARLGG